MPASTCSSSILQNAPFEGRQPKKLLLGYPRPLHNLFSIFVEYDLMKQWNILVNFTEYFNQTGASVPSILFGQGTFTTRAGKVKNTKRFKMLEWSKQKNLNTWERHFFSFCSLSGWIKWNGREKISYQLSLLWVEASGLPEKKKKKESFNNALVAQPDRPKEGHGCQKSQMFQIISLLSHDSVTLLTFLKANYFWTS